MTSPRRPYMRKQHGEQRQQSRSTATLALDEPSTLISRGKHRTMQSSSSPSLLGVASSLTASSVTDAGGPVWTLPAVLPFASTAPSSRFKPNFEGPVLRVQSSHRQWTAHRQHVQTTHQLELLRIQTGSRLRAVDEAREQHVNARQRWSSLNAASKGVSAMKEIIDERATLTRQNTSSKQLAHASLFVTSLSAGLEAEQAWGNNWADPEGNTWKKFAGAELEPLLRPYTVRNDGTSNLPPSPLRKNSSPSSKDVHHTFPASPTSRSGERTTEASVSAPVRLIDARYLVKLADSGGLMVRRQDAPKEAFISLKALRHMPEGCERSLRILVVSHMWLTPQHPDPRGDTLMLLATVLREFLKDYGGTYAVFLE